MKRKKKPAQKIHLRIVQVFTKYKNTIQIEITFMWYWFKIVCARLFSFKIHLLFSLFTKNACIMTETARQIQFFLNTGRQTDTMYIELFTWDTWDGDRPQRICAHDRAFDVCMRIFCRIRNEWNVLFMYKFLVCKRTVITIIILRLPVWQFY